MIISVLNSIRFYIVKEIVPEMGRKAQKEGCKAPLEERVEKRFAQIIEVG